MATNLLFLALLPGILIIIYIFRMDKVEHEPRSLIIKLLIFGVISCLPAMFFETLISTGNPGLQVGTVEYAFFTAFAVAALCEEFFKFLLLRLGSWRSKNFNYRFDGIVYGVAVAVGFALFENVMYVAQGGIETAIMRGILAVPLHAFCGVFMGVFYGAAKKYSIEGRKGKVINRTLLALVVPMLIHGIYDTLAFMESGFTTGLLLAFVAFMYIVAIRVVRDFSRDDWKAGFYTDALSDLPLDDKNQR
ncbi:MAG: PrsW family glutamic-type intramembrane protease [Clostridia bacterium]|nr:PrsW family glutamic-type intramembrane protease [Clostridia bacterium]